ncbi:MAG: 50S ribosomal protein L35 [Candidatus Riflebacteria bacterium]|nr:50S ribosomal protein L35 [Candidatus Riflebacteria bacterium]
MPKLKSHSGAKKRFRLKKSGIIKRNKAYLRHILSTKRNKRKRGLGTATYVFKGEARTIKRMLGH